MNDEYFGDEVVSEAIEVHPVLILGLAVMLISIGVMLSQTLFIAIMTETGVSVLVWAGLWFVMSLIIVTLGLVRML